MMLLFPTIAWAVSLPASFDAWPSALLAEPAAIVGSLADPSGPLSTVWPAVSGTLVQPPVWVLSVELSPATGEVWWSGVLAWTAPAGVEEVVLRVPASQMNARVQVYVDDRPLLLADGLARVPVPRGTGQTVAWKMRGYTGIIGSPDRLSHLLHESNAAVFTGWLPLPTPCVDGRGCDQRPWRGRSDPGGHEAMIVVARVEGVAAEWTLVTPGLALPEPAVIAAVAVRELPLIALRGWDSAGGPGVRAWTDRDPERARQLVDRGTRAREVFTRWYGPLSVPRIDMIAVTAPGAGLELPGIVLVPRVADRDDDYVIAHEIAHQWWYGEVGSDPLREPWVDEALACWSASVLVGAPDPAWWQVRPGAPAGGDAEALSPGSWTALYANGERYLRELAAGDPQRINAVLAEWLRTRRWRFATGDDLRNVLARDVGVRREEQVWRTWMAAGDSAHP